MLSLRACVHVSDDVVEELVAGCPGLSSLDLAHLPRLTVSSYREKSVRSCLCCKQYGLAPHNMRMTVEKLLGAELSGHPRENRCLLWGNYETAIHSRTPPGCDALEHASLINLVPP